MKTKNPLILKFIPPRNTVKNDDTSSKDFSSNKQQLRDDSPLSRTRKKNIAPILDTGSYTLSMFQQIGTPTFTMPHSAMAQVLAPTAHVEKSSSIIATGQSYVISMQLRMTSLTKSPKSIFSIVITIFPSTV